MNVALVSVRMVRSVSTGSTRISVFAPEAGADKTVLKTWRSVPRYHANMEELVWKGSTSTLVDAFLGRYFYP